MAILLGCENIGLEYPNKVLFNGVTLGIFEGDRIGIVGCNGEGKSTLLRILALQQEPEEGKVTWRGGLRVGLLAQQDTLDDAATVLSALVGDRPEYEWASDAGVRQVLEHLVGDLDRSQIVGELSGGQRRRLDLARLLIGDWDVLMLDEPTNHLDMGTIHWLAGYLRNRWPAKSGALLLATHDRWFLDEICLNMWEVGEGKVHAFEGGFSAYVQQRVEREQAAAAAAVKWRNMMRKELAWLSRGARARATKPKFHVKAARELIADIPEMRDSLELKKLASARLGKQVVDLLGVSARYDTKLVIDDVTWLVGPGDRFGILGENGAGKTTLLKLIEGKIKPCKGRVRIGQTVKMAVLSQRLDELEIHADRRVNEVLKEYRTLVNVDGKDLTPAQLLEKMGFAREQLRTPVNALSGGQKRRLQFLLTLLDEPNVLILDEPGNDLDIDMLAAMEDLLDAWPGTLFLVTHDRHLMERVTDQQFALIGGKLTQMPRGVDGYLELVAAQQAGRSTRSVFMQSGGEGVSVSPPVPADSTAQCALTQNELRALRKRKESDERKMEKTEARLAELIRGLNAIDGTDFEALMKQQAAIDDARAHLEEIEADWLDCIEQLGE